MFYIRQGATHKVVIGPAVAVGDGFTPVTTLALSTADEAEVILHDNGTVVSISGYTWAAITTADGYYHLTLQSGISNTVGHMTVVINDDSLCLPLRADFTVLEEAVYDAMFAGSAPGYVANAPVNVAQFGGSNGTFASGRPEVNTTHIGGTSQTGRDIGASVLLSSGTGTGQLLLSSGVASANAVQISGSSTAADNVEVVYDTSFALAWDGDSSAFNVNVDFWLGETTSGTSGVPNVNVNSIAANALTATAIANDAITAAKLASDVTTELQSGLATSTALATAQADLDILTGSDGVTLATTQANYAPATSAALATAQADLDIITGTAGALIDAGTGTGQLSISSGLLAWNPAWDTEVESECNDALVALHLDHLLAATYDPASKPGAADALLNELVESDSGVSRFTVNALENAPSGSGASAEAIADEVQTRTIAAVTTVTTTTNLTNLPTIPANWLTAAGTAADFTTEIQSGLATATELAKVPKSDSNVTWNATALGSILTQAASALTTYDPPTNTEFEARTLAAASYATASALGTAQADLDILTGTDGVTLATTQPNYAPAVAGDEMDFVDAPNATAITAIQSGLASQSSVNDIPTNAELATALDALPTAAENAAALLDATNGIETGLTLRNAMRLIAAASAGKLDGAATTTVTIRNAVADSKDRIVATVTEDGNRTAITYDLT